MHGLIINVRRYSLLEGASTTAKTVCLLLLGDQVLGSGDDTSFLNGRDGLIDHLSSQVWVGRKAYGPPVSLL